jgi:hypothetical protein
MPVIQDCLQLGANPVILDGTPQLSVTSTLLLVDLLKTNDRWQLCPLHATSGTAIILVW